MAPQEIEQLFLEEEERPDPIISPAPQEIEQLFPEEEELPDPIISPALQEIEQFFPEKAIDGEIKQEENELIAMNDSDAAELERIFEEQFDDALNPNVEAEQGETENENEGASNELPNTSIEHNTESFQEVANETHETDDDITEIEFIGPYPQPMKNCTDDLLTKQENDPVSGNLPYALKVSVIWRRV